MTEEERGNWVECQVGNESWKKKTLDLVEKEETGEKKKGEKKKGEKKKGEKKSELPDYLIEAYANAGENGLAASMSQPEITLLNLLPNTRYDFRIRAAVKDGTERTAWGDAIESPSISTEVGVPEPPSGLVVGLVTHDSVFVEWERPEDNGLPVEGFQLCVRLENMKHVINENQEENQEAKKEDQEEDQEENQEDNQEENQEENQEAKKEDQEEDQEENQEENQEDNQEDNQEEKIEEATMFIPMNATGMPPTTSGIEDILLVGQNYICEVIAMNECGWGPPSKHVRFSTRSIHAPLPPWTIPAVMSGDTFVLVEWQAVEGVDQYRLQRSSDYDAREHVSALRKYCYFLSDTISPTDL